MAFYVKRQIMTITDSLNDLQDVLKQQNSIYETNQNLHFDWLKSVLFQLDVYDQSNKKEIKVNESESKTDSEKIRYNCHMQQQKVLSNCKKQYRKISNENDSPKSSPKKHGVNHKSNENSNCTQKEVQPEPASPSSGPKLLPRSRKRINRLQAKAASTSFITSPVGMSNNCTNYEKSNLKKVSRKNINAKHDKEEVTSPSQLLKFVDKDSLLPISQSSSCSDFCNDETNYETNNGEEQLRLCQSLPSKNGPLTISCNILELTQSVSSFQEKWQEMVEEKKRSSLLPKPPVGALFKFDETPDSYQITSSEDDEDSFSFSDGDDEIHEEDPLEIHGKMIPVWARKENVEEQLRSQETISPDDIFTGMPKQCQISQIFEDYSDKVKMSILAEGHWDENDNCDELMAT